ncbi:unnamed protein product, partial [Rotaria sordida]
FLQELIINNCGIEQIKLPNQVDSNELFQSLKYLYMSDNKISSYSSINELSRISSLISFSILRNPIYGLNQFENETAKQMIIARLPNLTYLNRVLISHDERRGAEIDYLQRYAQDYFDTKLDFINEHRQYQRLINKYGEPLKQNKNQESKKGLCIRRDLLKVIFEFGDENEIKIEKKIPSSMTIAKLKTFVRKLFPSQLTNDIQFNLFVVIDKKHKELIKQYNDHVIDLSSQSINEFDVNHYIYIYINLSQINELNIRQNLIKNWSQLWIILEKYFPKLEILKVSNSRINFDINPSNEFINIKQIVLIDIDNDCHSFEYILKYFPNLIDIHLDLNHLTFISENFVNKIKNVTNLSLSDNQRLIEWDPFINRLGLLPFLQELIINNCGIEQIKLPNQVDSNELFQSLKYLYMSDNKISSYSSINELSRISSLISFSILRNPIYGLNQFENETAKQMIIARLPNLTYLNRVLISHDERRGAEIDYLQRYAQDYFD